MKTRNKASWFSAVAPDGLWSMIYQLGRNKYVAYLNPENRKWEPYLKEKVKPTSLRKGVKLIAIENPNS